MFGLHKRVSRSSTMSNAKRLFLASVEDKTYRYIDPLSHLFLGITKQGISTRRSVRSRISFETLRIVLDGYPRDVYTATLDLDKRIKMIANNDCVPISGRVSCFPSKRWHRPLVYFEDTESARLALYTFILVWYAPRLTHNIHWASKLLPSCSKPTDYAVVYTINDTFLGILSWRFDNDTRRRHRIFSVPKQRNDPLLSTTSGKDGSWQMFPLQVN